MNKTIIFIISAVVVLLILIALFLLYPRGGTVPSPVATSTNPFGNPIATTTTNVTALPIVLNDGSVVNVPDFTATDQPTWASPIAGYQVAGSAESDFLITYIVPDPVTHRPQFLITLLKEPIGPVRLAAEGALRAKLGLSNAQMCSLDTVVMSGPGVNDDYTGKRLGLSFCPGAIALPN